MFLIFRKKPLGDDSIRFSYTIHILMITAFAIFNAIAYSSNQYFSFIDYIFLGVITAYWVTNIVFFIAIVSSEDIFIKIEKEIVNTLRKKFLTGNIIYTFY